MKKILGLLILLILAVSVQAQDTGPEVTAFRSVVTVADRSNLQNRRLRIPVSWNTANRPLTSNLYFEQVLPNDSWINVELPRLIPWVASSGDGVVAPIEPFPGATEITLRLRMVDLFTRQLYGEREFVIPIGNTGEPGADFGNVPTISRFSIQSPTILRSNLGTASGRIGVSWNAINRPLSATLVFEQVLPNGTVVNVELPRENPWVNSRGNGTVVPRDPGSSANQINLRVRLVDLINGRIYDQRSAVVNILTPTPTTIDFFRTSAASVTSQALAQGTARIAVSWSVSGRPPNSNLVFEQVLSDGRIINVELPRQVPIVPSSGNGVVAPHAPGGSATVVTLQLRLVNLSNGADYASRQIQVPIVNQPNPKFIATFHTNTTAVRLGELNANTARVPVTWALDSRPPNSNLVFEQLLGNGQRVNVELPRQNPIVPSSGAGVVAPVWPGENEVGVRLTLRLVDLSTQQTLDSAEIQLPIIGNQGGNVQYGEACFGTPYAPRSDISLNMEGTIIRGNVAGGLQAFNLPNGDVVETLPVGENFSVISGPACWTIQTIAPAQTDFRMWRIRTHRNNAEVWVHEYEFIVDGGRIEYYLRALQTTGGGEQDADPVVNSFSVDPAAAAPGASLTIAWDVSNASSVNVEVFSAASQSLQRFDSLSARQNLSYTVPASAAGPLRVVLTVEDSQGRIALTQEQTVSINCPVAAPLDPSRCPINQVAAQIVTQQYENGVMVWRDDTRKIYVLNSDGGFQVFDDTWSEGQPYDSGETPPSGLLLPNRGFGKVWTAQAGVRDRLGWATALEASATGTVETYAGSETWISLPNGRVLVLSQNNWRT